MRLMRTKQQLIEYQAADRSKVMSRTVLEWVSDENRARVWEGLLTLEEALNQSSDRTIGWPKTKASTET